MFFPILKGYYSVSTMFFNIIHSFLPKAYDIEIINDEFNLSEGRKTLERANKLRISNNYDWGKLEKIIEIEIIFKNSNNYKEK